MNTNVLFIDKKKANNIQNNQKKRKPKSFKSKN